MKHLLFVLLAFGGSADADTRWVEMPGGPGLRKYADSTSLVRLGEVARLTEVMNFESPRVFSGAVLFSIRWTSEYHCARRQTRVIGYQAHSEPMGSGPVLVAGAEAVDWSDVLDGSLASGVWRWVCQPPARS